MTEEAPSPAPAPGTHRWVSLMARDLPTSQRFYAALFGWEYQEGPQQLGPYVRAVRDGRQVAGLGATEHRAGQDVAWLPYVATADADATAARIRDCGGTLAVGPLDLEGVGRLAIVADVTCAPFGLWQGGRARRAPLRPDVGVPVWNELITVDSSLVSTFYELVFGYESVRDPGPSRAADYLVLRHAGLPVAGIRGMGGSLPYGRASHWLPYFSTTDVDGGAQRGEQLGGQLLREPFDSPLGRLAWLADPEGAPFGLVSPA
ncbi:VOC family protein [Streptomyces sp. 4N509B]|uniref:VOC family protein n=1 Tax=Streptomyces sp. 4N509B TaxID=3457413 RepID=UPI003FCFE41D